VRLATWPRNPYLNDELREWIALHLSALHVEDEAIYAIPQGRDDEGRRVLIATEIGLLDGSYAPRGSSAHYSLQVRLYPWPTVRSVDLLSETYRLWAYEHRTWWRLRIATPSLDVQTEDPDLGCALADLATACAVMAEAGAGHREVASTADETEAPSSPAPASPASRATTEALAIEPLPALPSVAEPIAAERSARGDEP
jgi:hypothetical protein